MFFKSNLRLLGEGFLHKPFKIYENNVTSKGWLTSFRKLTVAHAALGRSNIKIHQRYEIVSLSLILASGPGWIKITVAASKTISPNMLQLKSPHRFSVTTDTNKN